jgi:hypothetical protein
MNFNLDEFMQATTYWKTTDKDFRKMVSILAHCVNSVSSLALDFGYGLAFDFGLDLMQLVNWQRQCALLFRFKTLLLLITTFVQFVLYQQFLLEHSRMFLAMYVYSFIM